MNNKILKNKKRSIFISLLLIVVFSGFSVLAMSWSTNDIKTLMTKLDDFPTSVDVPIAYSLGLDEDNIIFRGYSSNSLNHLIANEIDEWIANSDIPTNLKEDISYSQNNWGIGEFIPKSIEYNINSYETNKVVKVEFEKNGAVIKELLLEVIYDDVDYPDDEIRTILNMIPDDKSFTIKEHVDAGCNYDKVCLSLYNSGLTEEDLGNYTISEEVVNEYFFTADIQTNIMDENGIIVGSKLSRYHVKNRYYIPSNIQMSVSAYKEALQAIIDAENGEGYTVEEYYDEYHLEDLSNNYFDIIIGEDSYVDEETGEEIVYPIEYTVNVIKADEESYDLIEKVINNYVPVVNNTKVDNYYYLNYDNSNVAILFNYNQTSWISDTELNLSNRVNLQTEYGLSYLDPDYYNACTWEVDSETVANKYLYTFTCDSEVLTKGIGTLINVRNDNSYNYYNDNILDQDYLIKAKKAIVDEFRYVDLPIDDNIIVSTYEDINEYRSDIRMKFEVKQNDEVIYKAFSDINFKSVENKPNTSRKKAEELAQKMPDNIKIPLKTMLNKVKDLPVNTLEDDQFFENIVFDEVRKATDRMGSYRIVLLNKSHDGSSKNLRYVYDYYVFIETEENGHQLFYPGKLITVTVEDTVAIPSDVLNTTDTQIAASKTTLSKKLLVNEDSIVISVVTSDDGEYFNNYQYKFTCNGVTDYFNTINGESNISFDYQSFILYDDMMSLNLGSTYSNYLELNDSEIIDYDIEYTISDPSVATLSRESNDWVVTLNDINTAVDLIATDKNSGSTDTMKIIRVDGDSDYIFLYNYYKELPDNLVMPYDQKYSDDALIKTEIQAELDKYIAENMFWWSIRPYEVVISTKEDGTYQLTVSVSDGTSDLSFTKDIGIIYMPENKLQKEFVTRYTNNISDSLNLSLTESFKQIYGDNSDIRDYISEVLPKTNKIGYNFIITDYDDDESYESYTGLVYLKYSDVYQADKLVDITASVNIKLPAGTLASEYLQAINQKIGEIVINPDAVTYDAINNKYLWSYSYLREGYINTTLIGEVFPYVDDDYFVDIEEIEFEDYQRYKVIDINEQYTLLYSVYPENNSYNNVTFVSSDTSIATVTNDGLVTGLKKGIATISAKGGSDNRVLNTYVIAVDTQIYDISRTSFRYDNNNIITRIASGMTISEFHTEIEKATINENAVPYYHFLEEDIEEDSIIKTGYIFHIDEEEYQLAVRGDINGDGLVTVTDLAKIRRHLAGLETQINAYLRAIDINDDGSQSITDLAKMRRHLAGLERF